MAIALIVLTSVGAGISLIALVKAIKAKRAAQAAQDAAKNGKK